MCQTSVLQGRVEINIDHIYKNNMNDLHRTSLLKFEKKANKDHQERSLTDSYNC